MIWMASAESFSATAYAPSVTRELLPFVCPTTHVLPVPGNSPSDLADRLGEPWPLSPQAHCLPAHTEPSADLRS